MGGAKPQEAQPDVDTSTEALIALMDAHEVGQVCAVQRAFIYGYDNSYILDAARAYPDRITPVLVVDATDASTPSLLRRLADGQRLGGIRLSAPRADPFSLDWLESPAAMETWRAAEELELPVAGIFFRTHRVNARAIPALARIARRFPGVPVVIDHVGVPHGTIYDGKYAGVPESDYPPGGAPGFDLDELVRGLAELRNTFFKVTSINFRRLIGAGIPTASFVRHLADVFGADRLMWGSDVGQTRGLYGPKVDAARMAASELSPAERAAFLHDTGARLYMNA